MIRTEDDLRAMYDELASPVAPSPELLAVVDGLQPPPDPSARRSAPVRVVEHRYSRRRRWLTRAIAVAAAVALIAVALMMLRPPERASADPVQVLLRAGQVQAAVPDVAPRADQFYYARRGSTEMWVSVDGTHDGGTSENGGPIELIPGCKDGSILTEGNYQGERPQPCVPNPFYVPDLPATGTEMAAYLTQRYGKYAGANGIGKGAAELLAKYVRPRARTAIFEALTQVPGLRLVDGSQYGPNTLAITWSVAGPDNQPDLGASATYLVFNQTTGAYLGLQTFGIKGEPSDVPQLDQIDPRAFVDKVGERP